MNDLIQSLNFGQVVECKDRSLEDDISEVGAEEVGTAEDGEAEVGVRE